MKIVRAVLAGGLAAGVLDILYAFVVYGPLSGALGLPSSTSPAMVLQSVAGGWIGRDAAFAGGAQTAALGALTHFAIALIMASVFVLAAAVLRSLTRNAWFWGIVYGLVLFVVMNYVVVPLSAAADGHFASSIAEASARIGEAIDRALAFRRPLLLAGTILTHTVFVGVPIALAAKRYLGQQD
ncbi:MAG: hypothetical protein JNJ63_12350 [Hyphomonadaceae bacterium]|nr:hypothetical protein [Hyphomonadaceae bacterium]